MWFSTYSIYAVVGFIGFGVLFLLLFVFLFVSHWNMGAEARQSLAYSYTMKISGLVLIFIKYILFQPMVTVMMTTITCSKSDLTENVTELGYDCYSDVHIILMVSAGLVILIMFALGVIATLFFSDEDPDSKLPWAYCSRLLEIYKLARKLIVSISIYAVAGNASTGATMMLVSISLNVLSLYTLYKQIHMQDKKVLYVMLTAEGIVTWFSLLSLIYVVSDLNWTHPIAVLVFMVAFFTCVVLGGRERATRLLCQHGIEAMKDPDDVEMYCRVLMDKLATSKTYSEVAIEGFLQMHTSRCRVEQCPCRKKLCKELEPDDEEEKLRHQHHDEMSKDENLSADCKKVSVERLPKQTGTIATIIDVKSTGRRDEADVNDKAKLNFMKIIINDLSAWNERQEGKARLHIYVGYLKAACLKNKLAALYEVMCANESNPNVYERFLAYRLMYSSTPFTFCSHRIEEQFARKDSRTQGSNEIDNLITFQQVLAEMQENMQEVLKLFVGFWKELQDESPNFQYLGNMSHDITQTAQKIRAQYRRLITINPSNLYCRMLYALFLKKIMKDEFEAFDVYNEYSEKSLTAVERTLRVTTYGSRTPISMTTSTGPTARLRYSSSLATRPVLAMFSA